MFYKPNFCSNCGERIERADWHVTTSRRFCAVCSAEHMGKEWLPRAIVAVAVLFGLFGIGTIFTSPKPAQITQLKALPTAEPRPPVRPEAPPAETQPVAAAVRPAGIAPAPERPAIEQQKAAAVDDAVFYCGAMTKKGKPCSRRVKTKGRCWQHTGQPSALVSQSTSDVY